MDKMTSMTLQQLKKTWESDVMKRNEAQEMTIKEYREEILRLKKKVDLLTDQIESFQEQNK